MLVTPPKRKPSNPYSSIHHRRLDSKNRSTSKSRSKKTVRGKRWKKMDLMNLMNLCFEPRTCHSRRAKHAILPQVWLGCKVRTTNTIIVAKVKHKIWKDDLIKSQRGNRTACLPIWPPCLSFPWTETESCFYRSNAQKNPGPLRVAMICTVHGCNSVNPQGPHRAESSRRKWDQSCCCGIRDATQNTGLQIS